MLIYSLFSITSIEISVQEVPIAVIFDLSALLHCFLRPNIHFLILQYTLLPLAMLQFYSKNLQLVPTHHLHLNNP